MPTGYTDSIKRNISFKEFAFNCARAFGACIDMRDEPLSTGLPDKLPISTYHRDELKAARKELKQFKSCPKAKLRLEYKKYLKSRQEEYLRSKKENNSLKAKYTKMLANVEKWVPPSEEHFGLKKFMIDQIVMSIESDCHPVRKPSDISFQGWINDRLKDLNWSVNYHNKHWKKENKDNSSRQSWIDKLKESVK